MLKPQAKMTKALSVSFTVTLAVTISSYFVLPSHAEEEESAQMHKAEALFRANKIKEAAEAYRDVISKEPDNSKAHERLGACLAADATATKNNDEYDTAVLEEKTAIRLDPKYALPHAMLGKIYADQGKTDEALDEFRASVKLKPTSLMAHLDLGLWLTFAGKDDEAISVYKKAVELDAKDCRAHTNLGVLYDMKDDYDSAIKEELVAIDLASKANQPEMILKSNINLGNFYVNRGELDQAVAAFRAALKVSGKDPNAHSGLGWSLEKKGDYKGAIAEQRKAISMMDDFAVAHRRLAEALAGSGDKAQAEAEFKKAVTIAPKDVTATVQYGKFLEQQGRASDAITQYKKAIEINPNCKIAQDALSNLNKSHKPQ